MQLTCRLIFVLLGVALNCQSWVIPFQKLGHHQNYLSRRTLKLVNVSMVPQLATAESLLGTSSKPTIPEKNTEQIWVCLKIWYPIHRSSPKHRREVRPSGSRSHPTYFSGRLWRRLCFLSLGSWPTSSSHAVRQLRQPRPRRPRGHWSGRSCRTWQRHKHRATATLSAPWWSWWFGDGSTPMITTIGGWQWWWSINPIYVGNLGFLTFFFDWESTWVYDVASCLKENWRVTVRMSSRTKKKVLNKV